LGSASGATANGSTDDKMKEDLIRMQILSALRGKNKEEIINMWNGELEECLIAFRKQAIKIAKWDRLLIENCDRIMQLRDMVQRNQSAQKQLDSDLEIINRQQEELHQLLGQLEERVIEIYQDKEKNGFFTPADIEREKGYQLAELINNDLNQMSNTLTEITTKISTTRGRSIDPDSAIYQVTEILDAHLRALQRLDHDINSKLGQVDKMLKMQQMEQQNFSSRMRKAWI